RLPPRTAAPTSGGIHRRGHTPDDLTPASSHSVTAMNENIDILDAHTWGPGAHDRFRWLRENDPVHWDAKNAIWAVAKHPAVVFASTHPRTSRPGRGPRPTIPPSPSIAERAEPRHGQLRNLINRGSKPRRVADIEARFREFTVETMEKIQRQGTCDFVRDI